MVAVAVVNMKIKIIGVIVVTLDCGIKLWREVVENAIVKIDTFLN